MRAIVIKPDGVAVFDADLHPIHRSLMLGDLADMGHTLQFKREPHPVHQAGQVGASHALLLSGPHSKAEQDKRRQALANATPASAERGVALPPKG